MSKNLTGKKMPKFKAHATSEKEISSADFENKNLVISINQLTHNI
jgi:peroxiredoxin